MDTGLKVLWSTLTAVGTRRFSGFVSFFLHSYQDTAFYFGGVDDLVALSIDDGLSRGGKETSMTREVQELLQKFDATCTFFVCSSYLEGLHDEAMSLVAAGHELGNHLAEDRTGYANLPADKFDAELRATTTAIERIPGAPRVRWFRAPQGVYTGTMRKVVKDHGLRHAIGDVYCDDWGVRDAKWIARTLLQQVKPGSIIIMHMPERRFREQTFEALELVLQGLSKRGLKCTTLSDLAARATSCNDRAVEEGAARPQMPPIPPPPTTASVHAAREEII